MDSLAPGAKLLGYWRSDEAWYRCEFLKYRDDKLKVRWDDGTKSALSTEEVRPAKRRKQQEQAVKKAKLEGGVPRPLSEDRSPRLPPHRYVMAPMVGGSELPFRR
ncbi:unnamed protein product [Effrenium voratum]|nr:unnamed protein product [Effrenium voratum]